MPISFQKSSSFRLNEFTDDASTINDGRLFHALGEEELANVQPVMMLIKLRLMTSQVVVTRLKCEEMTVVDVLLASQNLIRLDEVTPQPTLL